MKSVERMTLEELRIYHHGHTGFIWQCKYCGRRYAELIEQKADRLSTA